MKRSRMAMISVTVLLLLSGCGDRSENISTEVLASDEGDSREAADNAAAYFDALTPNELATGIYRLSHWYDFSEELIEENNYVIHSVIDENDGFGSEILTTHPQFNGLEYLIAFDDDYVIGQLYVYRPEQEDYGIGCYGEIQDITELGVSHWNELLSLYGNGIPDGQNEVRTMEYSITDFTENYDKAVVPTITLTGNKRAIESFHISCLEGASTVNIPIEGRLGSVYDFSTKGNVENIVLTFEFDTDLLFISDLSDDKFLPAIYCYDDKTFAFTEIAYQTRFGNSVSAPLEHLGTYVLMNKIETEEFMGTDLDF